LVFGELPVANPVGEYWKFARASEDALAFKHRIEQEVRPVMERVRSLMKKLGDLAQAKNA
jgi:hypothetical protein